jgi:CheY-like chemotaxis protein
MTTTTILLVDNEPENTSVLSMGLEDEGFKVDAFNDPILALSNFKANFYSLSILDINMPGINGYEFYREIKKLDAKIKVCFLTASEIYNEKLRVPPTGLLDGVNCFIPKPVDIDELVRKVKKELNL